MKIAVRRATLLGLNAPIGHAVRIVQHEPAAAQTSTQRIRAALARLQGISSEERALLNAEDDEGYTPQRRAEIDRLRAERGPPPLPAPGENPDKLN